MRAGRERWLETRAIAEDKSDSWRQERFFVQINNDACKQQQCLEERAILIAMPIARSNWFDVRREA